MRSPLLLSLFLCACSADGVPENVMQPEKMEAVLYDVIRTDEWVDFAVLQDSTFRGFAKRGALYDSVFSLHRITKEEYRRSMAFYQSRPDLLKPVLDSLRVKSDTAVKRATDTTQKKVPKPVSIQ